MAGVGCGKSLGRILPKRPLKRHCADSASRELGAALLRLFSANNGGPARHSCPNGRPISRRWREVSGAPCPYQASRGEVTGWRASPRVLLCVDVLIGLTHVLSH